VTEGLGLQLCIIVQEENGIGAGGEGGFDAQVVATGETKVASRVYDRNSGPSGSDVLRRAIG
jgi:hypothetical protein